MFKYFCSCHFDCMCENIAVIFIYWEAQDQFCTLDWVLNLLYKLFILVAFYLRALIRGNFCIVYYTIPKLPRINVTCPYLPHLTIYIYIYIYIHYINICIIIVEPCLRYLLYVYYTWMYVSYMYHNYLLILQNLL